MVLDKQVIPPHIQLEINTSHSQFTECQNSKDSEHRSWIVQKFGGTSIGKFIENITGTIIQ
jgi:aspartate kinase